METKIEEIWKDIAGFEGIYQVSDQGRIRRIKYYYRGRRPKSTDGIIAISMDTWGYPKLMLSKNSKAVPRRVHRLVAMAFVSNPNDKKTVNHKNGIKTDNRAENLEWSTMVENNIHARKSGLNKGRSVRVLANNPRRKDR